MAQEWRSERGNVAPILGRILRQYCHHSYYISYVLKDVLGPKLPFFQHGTTK